MNTFLRGHLSQMDHVRLVGDQNTRNGRLVFGVAADVADLENVSSEIPDVFETGLVQYGVDEKESIGPLDRVNRQQILVRLRSSETREGYK